MAQIKVTKKQELILNMIRRKSEKTGWARYYDIQNPDRGLRALEVLEQKGLIERVEFKGQRLTEAGKQIANWY